MTFRYSVEPDSERTGKVGWGRAGRGRVVGVRVTGVMSRSNGNEYVVWGKRLRS
jgi:hypothetical protein